MYTDPAPIAMWACAVLGGTAFTLLIWIMVYDWVTDRRRKRRRLAERAARQKIHTPAPLGDEEST